MKQIKEELLYGNLMYRLAAVAQEAAISVTNRNHVEFDSSFEESMDEFGLAYGVGKLFEQIKQQMSHSKNGRAHVRGPEFIEALDATIGYALLLKDYIQRNPHLITDGKQEESVAAPVQSTPVGEEKVQLMIPLIGQEQEQSFKPDLPANTTVGEEPYDAR